MAEESKPRRRSVQAQDEKKEEAPKVAAEAAPWRAVNALPGTEWPKVQVLSVPTAQGQRLRNLWRNLSMEEHHEIAIPERVRNGSLCGDGSVLLACINGIRFFGRPGRRYTVPCSVAQRAYLARTLPVAPNCEVCSKLPARLSNPFPMLAVNSLFPHRQDPTKAPMRQLVAQMARRNAGAPTGSI